MRFQLNADEKKLIDRCIRGDEASRYRLYNKYVDAMYNTVIRMVVEPMDAEDVIQDTFLSVFTKLHTFKGDATLGAWIKRIAINTALNYIRKYSRISYLNIENAQMPPNEEMEEKSPIDIKIIHHAIKELPEGCRIIFSLFLLEGYQHKEIAGILSISESTSKSQYQRARRLLQEKLNVIHRVKGCRNDDKINLLS